jgi:hypothetical protein
VKPPRQENQKRQRTMQNKRNKNLKGSEMEEKKNLDQPAAGVVKNEEEEVISMLGDVLKVSTLVAQAAIAERCVDDLLMVSLGYVYPHNIMFAICHVPYLQNRVSWRRGDECEYKRGST